MEQRAAGLRRKLVCLVLHDGREDGAPPLHGAETIWRDGACVGYVRSTAFGHTLGRSIAYGYVDCPDGMPMITNKWLCEGGWCVGDRGAMLAAELQLKAPFDPENRKVRGLPLVPGLERAGREMGDGALR